MPQPQPCTVCDNLDRLIHGFCTFELAKLMVAAPSCQNCQFLMHVAKALSDIFRPVQFNKLELDMGDAHRETRDESYPHYLRYEVQSCTPRAKLTGGSDDEGPPAALDGLTVRDNGPKRTPRWSYNTSAYDIFLHQKTPLGGGRLASLIRTLPHRSEDMSSTEAVVWVLEKLQECKELHNSCNRRQGEPRLPTRVLDLKNGRIRLLTTNGRLGDYAALSHCWGSPSDELTSRPLETTASKLDDFQKDISFHALPQTFKDAVEFTLKLGLRYLWIDSLCIIQGCAADWDREAGRMADVYSNALVTLAAASATNAGGGLFHTKSTTRKILPDDTSQDGLFVRETLHPLQQCPLLTRAWTLQERLLSPRVLYFTHLELVWECDAHCLSESGLAATTEQVATVSHYHGGRRSARVNAIPKRLLSTMWTTRARPPSPAAFGELWRHLVDGFSHLALTYRTDKLPAIAGIAKRLRPGLDGAYLAGHWERTFVPDLMWHNEDLRDPRSTQLPSWSWANSSGPVSYPVLRQSETAPSLVELCTLESLDFETANSRDPFLGVDPGGSCVISGYLIPMTQSSAGWVTLPEDFGWISQNQMYFRNQNQPWMIWMDYPGALESSEPLWYLPVGAWFDGSDRHTTRREGQPPAEPQLYGLHLFVLVLRRRRRGGQQVHERIGSAQILIADTVRFAHVFEGHDALESMLECQLSYAPLYAQEKTWGNTQDPEMADEIESAAWSAMDRWSGPTGLRNDEDDGWFQDMIVMAHYYADEDEPREGGFFEDWGRYCGWPVIARLRRRLEAERERVREWRRRQAAGEEPEHARQRIVLV